MFYNINWAKSKVYVRMHIIYKMKRRTGYCTIQMSTIILSVFKNLINFFYTTYIKNKQVCEYLWIGFTYKERYKKISEHTFLIKIKNFNK